MARFALGVMVVFASAMPAAATDPSYTKDVVPIIDKFCLECHVGKKPKGGYDLSSVAKMLESGDAGTPTVVPGKPDNSPLFLSMTGKGRVMPPRDFPARPAAQDLAIIRKWIADGAKDDTPKSQDDPN